MKKIAAFLHLPNIDDYPLSKEDYIQAYSDLSEEVKKAGGDFYIVRGQGTYLGEGKFSKSWQFNGLKLVETGLITVDVVFDKGVFVSDDKVKVFNHPTISEICTDKWKMYELFAPYCPFTLKVESADQLSSSLDQIKTDLAVAKPVDGEEGKDVHIDRKEVIAQAELKYPLLLQEFLDSSVGIPGLVEGLHDFRIAVINGEIIYSYYRTPPQGSFLANVARGGRFSMVSTEKVPQSMKDIVTKVDAIFAQYGPRFYGVDFAMTKDGPKIIEMNSRLGLLPNRDDAVFLTTKQKLAEIFTTL